MVYNPSDAEIFVIANAAGVTPTTGVWNYLPAKQGGGLNLSADKIASEIVNFGRAAGDAQFSFSSASGSYSTYLQRSTSMDLMLESAFGGAFASNILKAGKTDKPFSLEHKMASNAINRYGYNLVTGLSLSATVGAFVECEWEILGTTGVQATTALGTTTYGTAPTTTPLAGKHVKNMSITGLGAVKWRAIEASISHNREALGELGSTNAFALGTSGNREATVSVEIYLDDLSPYTLFNLDGSTVAFEFDTGEGDDGYNWSFPRCTFSLPERMGDGAATIVKVELTAGLNSSDATDIILTKLAD